MLRRFQILQPLPEGRLEDLAQEMLPRSFTRQQTVVHKGSTSRSLFFLVDGMCKVTDLTESGREVGLALIQAGDHFGEMALIQEATRSASVVSLRDALLLELPQKPAEELVFGEPEVARFVMQRLAQIIQTNNDQRALLRCPSAYARIYEFLASLARPADEGQGWVVDHLPTQEDIAAMTDTSRETVSRALAFLRREEVIQKRGSGLFIPDLDRLEDKAEMAE
jgi:CRP-like cAMP-binding protein